MSEHSLGEEAVHHRWNAALPPAVTIRSGDTVCFRCRDSSDGQVTPHSNVADYMRIDRERIHALTGPVYVEDARAGDVLQVDVLEVAHGGWGWSSIFPGLGLLADRFLTPQSVHLDAGGELVHVARAGAGTAATVLRDHGGGTRAGR